MSISISENQNKKEFVFEKTKNELKWYIFYTCPRAEKIAYGILEKRGYDVFLPLLKTKKIWKNRQKKLVEIPLFPSYIFVNTNQHELYNIIKLPKITNFISNNNNPSYLRLKDVETVKKMISLDQAVFISTDFYEGDEVRILYGPLAGHEGLLIKQKGKTRFGIQLKEINHTVLIDVCTSVLKKLS